MEFLLTPDLTQSLLALTSVVITGFVGWLAPVLKSRWGFEIDERARQTLHSALNTGAMLAWSRVSDDVKPPTTQDMVDILLSHVLGEGAPDAVAKLRVSQPALRGLAEAKIIEVGALLGHRLIGAAK